MISDKELIAAAKKAQKRSYSPYSHFAVGSALLTKSGKIYTGANIENKSFSPTVCAERVAFFKAISEGDTEFEKIAITGSGKGFCAPCGVCRQVMSEFCEGDFKIILENGDEIKEFTLSQLLPCSFEMSGD